MRCYKVQIDPMLVKGTNTEAIVYAPNSTEAKAWGEKRWNVAVTLIQAEPVGEKDIPKGTKIADVTKPLRKAKPRKEPQEASQKTGS